MSSLLSRLQVLSSTKLLPNVPEDKGFLIRSVFAISIIGVLLIAPFTVLNIVAQRWLVAGASAAVLIVCVCNVICSYKGKYSLYLNLLGLAPGLAFSIIFAIQKINVMGTFWAYMALCTFYLVLPLRQARMANIILLATLTVVSYLSLDPAVYIRFVVTLFGCSLFMYFCFGEIDHQRRLLKRQSQTDPLTKVLNRSSLDEELSDAILQFKNENTAATICTFDLDHFKNINDEHGHDVGDRVLVDFSKTLRGYMGKNDLLFRVGGEEFLLLMKGSNAQEGCSVAEALRAVIEDTKCLAGIKVTVSAGVSELQAGYSWRLWMKDSDDKLYRAKNTGRNKVVC